MVPSVPKAQKRNLLSDPVFQRKDLFAPATLDAARHTAGDVSLYRGSQSRPSTSPETTQWRPFSSSSASRGRTQSSSAPAPPQRSQALFLEAFYAPEEIARSPRVFFGGRSLSSLCGPVGFRGVMPHHRPIHPEHFHQRFHMDRFPMGGVYYQLRVLCFGLTTATHVFTRLMAPISTILHHYVVGMLRYLDDWLILAVSRRGTGSCKCVRSWDYKSLQKVILDSISGHDLSRHADPVSSVHYKTDSDVGRKSPRDHRGVSFIPGPPSCSLVSSSGPPFVPNSSGEGWDVKGAISPDSPQFQMGLPRRIASHPLGSSVSGGSSMVVLGDSTT